MEGLGSGLYEKKKKSIKVPALFHIKMKEECKTTKFQIGKRCDKCKTFVKSICLFYATKETCQSDIGR